MDVAEGISSMHRLNIAFRDFARGSMIVTDNDTLKIIRVYHPYYGILSFKKKQSGITLRKNCKK